MKVKVTKKEIKNNYNDIISIGYCNAQFLLKGQEIRYYSSSNCYGWCCDYYVINNKVISTGYSPIGNIIPSYDLIKKYDNKAREVYFNYDIDYNERTKKINKLLEKFINELEKQVK